MVRNIDNHTLISTNIYLSLDIQTVCIVTPLQVITLVAPKGLTVNMALISSFSYCHKQESVKTIKHNISRLILRVDI